MIKEITIPSAGQKKEISLTGRSIYTFSGSRYSALAEAPILEFSPGISKEFLLPYSKYPNTEYFDSIYIHGTAESAGDTFIIQSTPFCIEKFLNVNYGTARTPLVGTTFTKTMDGTVQSFSDLELANSDGELPTKIYTQVAPLVPGESGIKYAYNVDPAIGKETMGFPLSDNPNEPLEIEGLAWIKAVRFINAESGETPLLITQPEY